MWWQRRLHADHMVRAPVAVRRYKVLPGLCRVFRAAGIRSPLRTMNSTAGHADRLQSDTTSAADAQDGPASEHASNDLMQQHQCHHGNDHGA